MMRGRFCLVILALLLPPVLSSCGGDDLTIFQIPEGYVRKTKIIAHRGYWRANGSFENSLTAIKMAAEIGADGIEFDLRRTSDDTIVVNHNASYAGLKISSTPYSILAENRLPNGEVLPTLRDYLKEIKKYPGLILFIELKTADVADLLYEILLREHIDNQIFFISFSRQACLRMIELNPYNQVALVQSNGEVESCSLMVSAGYKGLAYSWGFYSENQGVIRDGLVNNMVLSAWTVDSPERYSWLNDQGFSFAISDRPDLLLVESNRDIKYWHNVD